MTELLTFWLPWCLAGFAVATLGFVVRRARILGRELDDAPRLLVELAGDPGEAGPLARVVRAHIVGAHRAAADPYILSRPLGALRRDYADDELSHAPSFWIGGLLTGVALIFTFVLIARVMTSDVSDAIKHEAAADQLGSAVNQLGGKFFISAAGIGGSVLLLIVTNLMRKWIRGRAERVDPTLLAAFTSLEAMQLNAKLHELELLRAEREDRAAQHAEVCGHLASLDERSRRLSSIEVSVQAIGNEVSANLKNLMKDAMGDELRGILTDTMAEVAAIAERVQAHLTEALQANLHALAEQLQHGLAAVQRAVEGQAQGQLEQILGKLQDAVSGGFQSESRNMVGALEAFARVVPALEHQLRQMTGEIAEDSRRRSAESAEAAQVLMSQVSGMVEAMAAQQAAGTQALELRHADLETRVAGAASVVAQASDGLARSAHTLAEISSQSASVLVQARQGSEALQASTRELAGAGSALAGSVTALQDVVSRTRTQTQEQQALLLKQREYTREVEHLWPALFDTYLAKFQTSANLLGQSWKDLHDRIMQVSNHVGSQFVESTESLSEAVDKLVRHSNGRGAS